MFNFMSTSFNNSVGKVEADETKYINLYSGIFLGTLL